MNKIKGILVIVTLLTATLAFAQDQLEMKVNKVSDNLYFISGAGGNIGVLKSKDGLLLVDSGVPQAAELVRKKIQEFFNLPVKKMIITHYHQDHTGGTKILADGKEVIAQKNCIVTLQKMLDKAKKDPKNKKMVEQVYLPNVGYEDSIKIKFGSEIIWLLYQGPGHTNGDTTVIFEKNKVIHTGDLLFHKIVPYIDVKNGADTENWLKIINKLSKKYPNHKVIPGHGDFTDIKGYLRFAQYISYLHNSVKKAIASGKTSKQAQELITFENFKDLIEVNKFMTRKNNVAWVYQELTKGNKNQ